MQDAYAFKNHHSCSTTMLGYFCGSLQMRNRLYKFWKTYLSGILIIVRVGISYLKSYAATTKVATAIVILCQVFKQHCTVQVM